MGGGAGGGLLSLAPFKMKSNLGESGTLVCGCNRCDAQGLGKRNLSFHVAQLTEPKP